MSVLVLPHACLLANSVMDLINLSSIRHINRNDSLIICTATAFDIRGSEKSGSNEVHRECTWHV